MKWKSDPARRPAHIGAWAYRAFAVARLTRKGPDFLFDLKTISDLSKNF